MMRGVAGNSRNADRLPLLLTAAIHLGALLLALVAAKIPPEHRPIPEVYEVELYSASEATPEPRPMPASVQEVVKPPSVIPAATAPPRNAQTPAAAPTPAPASTARPKAISLSPLKERLAKETREREEEGRRRQVEDIKLNLKEALAEKQLRESARRAREAIAETYRVAPTRMVPTPQGNDTNPQGNIAAIGATASSGASSPTAEQISARTAYVSQLKEHLRRHWKLPVLQDWDDRLSATMVIRIKRDGGVISTWFEKHSDNPRFDRYVKAAVDRSSPLPPMPREFTQKSEEIAVTFTPGGLN